MRLMGNASIVRLCASPDSEQRYGEPTPVGLRRLLIAWPDECALDDSSVLYDVGSGFGRLAAFLRIHSNASSIRGVEVNECRHVYAESVLDTVRRARTSEAVGEMAVLHGDVRRVGISDATHVFLAAQLFGEALLFDLFSLALVAPRLRCVVLLSRKLPEAWSERVSGLATSFGQAVAVNPVPTTYMGASAAFFRRGRCVAARSKPKATEELWGGRGRRQGCWTMDEVRAEMDRQGQRIMT